MSLKEIIIQYINHNGPMDIGQYMTLCMGHDRYGYYMTRDPFGSKGDFTTAPEISQMFGEILGAFYADLWLRAGQPEISLVEFGPGRGTLMADIMRGTSKVPGFHESISVYLVEISPVLKKAQARSLEAYQATWLDRAEELPYEKPLFCIGNEFLDALPVRHVVRKNNMWFEKCITRAAQSGFTWTLVPAQPELLGFLPEGAKGAEEDTIFETSPARISWIDALSERLKKQGGGSLFIDYGYNEPAPGETLQAVEKHKYRDILDKPGQQDLTAHVNFQDIENSAKKNGLVFHGPITQNAFLTRLGIIQRARALMKSGDQKHAARIQTDLERLTGMDHMGQLFKICFMADKNMPGPVGFLSEAEQKNEIRA